MTVLNTRTAAVAAFLLATLAWVSSAMASPRAKSVERYAPNLTYDGYRKQPLGAHDHLRFTDCPNSSASEANAEQQNFPVKQYGQTSGGYRCY